VTFYDTKCVYVNVIMLYEYYLAMIFENGYDIWLW